MKKTIITLAALTFAVAAHAQSTGTTSSAQTEAAAQGGSLVYAPRTNETSTVQYATSSAFAPPLTSSNDTCMGSTSMGATAMSWGVSVGSTWRDDNCTMLKNSRELWNQGNHAAALALMCGDDDIRFAISTSGGILDRRSDGAVIRRGCGMTKAEWIAAGRPLLNESGAPVQPGEVVTQAPAPKPAQTISSVDALGVKTTITPN